MTNRLAELMKTGQSVWFDNLTRGMIDGGEIARMIEEDDLRGMTSNPTIFEKAIVGSAEYDSQLRALVSEGRGVQEIYEGLVLQDIGRAADLFRPVYDRHSGRDGFISLEVDPRLAYQTGPTVSEAERLRDALDRPNVMIKIPASQEGIPAIEEAIYRGVSVNITMIFSVENYEQVAEAYIRGLERRAAEGKSVEGIASVASFFVSRVDTSVDKELERLINESRSDEEKRALTSLLGKAGVANAKLAYARFKEIFHGPRFADLLARGAQVQRPLWASTGTKNPKYSDVLYVDNLVGPETVNTVPPQTYAAFLDHGQVALTLERDLDEARAVFDRLAGVGVDLKDVTEKLQTEGLKAFVNSFEALLASIEAKRGALMSGINEELRFSPGRYADAVSAALKEADKSDVMRRIWRKDPTVWKRQDESATTEEAEAVEKHHQNIRNSLGWLNVVGTMRAAEGELIEFAGSIRDAGFRHVMLCGMGGSSLAPEVLRRSFGPREGWPELLVLDSTDPDTLDEFARKIDVASCLFVIASKSGTTVEPSAFHKFWFAEVGKKKENAGENFVAVTDPGTHLEALAKEQNFRRVFTNPADIGGRYSALSYFGMVPAALMGLDVRRLLERAERVAQACGAVVPAADNPGARLGALVAACALDGRDKLTLVTDEKVASFGLWVEQLVAESTGKEGKGVIPVAGEPLGAPGVYGDDRLFVSVSVGQPASDVESALRALEAAGHPVVYRTLSDRFDIAEDFFLWEIATAFAGHRLGINPFDQPDVQKAKLATRDLLKAYDERGLLEDTRPTTSDGLLTLYADEQMRGLLDSASLVASVRAFLRQARGGDYFAFLSYVEETPAHDELIQALRVLLRDSTRRATTAGYGPRYLHSTGQLHKGGPPEGVFFLLTAPDAVDFEVPGERYSFTTLKNAQALGDFHTLTSSGRRAVRVDLGGDIAAGLRRLADVLRDVSVLQAAGAEGD